MSNAAYTNMKLEELKRVFESSARDVVRLRVLLAELKRRQSQGAAALAAQVQARITAVAAAEDVESTNSAPRRQDAGETRPTIRCDKRVPLRLPPWEKLTPDEQIPIANLALGDSYIVTGGPGTGKTVLAIYRAEQAASRAVRHGRTDAVKLLVYNRTLCSFLQAAVSDRKLPESIVSTWHSFLWRHYKDITEGDDVPTLEPFSPDWAKVEPVLRQRAKPMFDHVVVDEAQDVPLPLMRILKLYSRSMTLFYDAQQSIHGLKDAPQSIAEVVNALELAGRRYHLSKNIRNTREIAAVAHLFFSGDERDVPAHAVRSDPSSKPIAQACGDLGVAATQIASFWLSHPEAVVGVLVPPDKELAGRVFQEIKEHLTKRSAKQECVQLYVAGKDDGGKALDFGLIGVKVMTYLSAGGLEFDAVFMPQIDDPMLEKDAAVSTNRMHVACSRARNHLVLMYAGNNPTSFVLKKMNSNRDLFRWIDVAESEEPF